MQGAGEASRACADDQDVGFELFALDVGGVGHGAILAEEENEKKKIENWGSWGGALPEIVEFGDFGWSFAARRLRAEGVQKYCIEISKLLITRGLSFSGIAKRLQKYCVEIRTSVAGELGETLRLRYGRRKVEVRLATEGGLSKIFTNYASTRRAKLRTVVCVHDEF